MPLPSFYTSRDNARAWSITRAASYGAALGALAALLKLLTPWHEPHTIAAIVREFAGAALAFALLCAAAAALRNFIAREVIWRGDR
jgi:hypothetical protein